MAPTDRGRSEGRPRQCVLPAASALAAGLYLSRLWCEARPAATPWVAFVASLAAGVALSALAVSLLLRLRLSACPLLLTGAYGLFPLPSPRLALAVGLIAVVTLVTQATTRWAQARAAREAPRPRQVPSSLLDLLVAGAFVALYVATLAPSVQPADAGEFQLVAAILGIAHPPGYPLYTLLGKAFTLLPLGDPAWRVNLFAAACAAGALGIVSRAVRRATGSAVAGVLAALTLGLVPTFWSQATVANVRSLTALLTALAMFWLISYGEGHAPRHLVAFAATFSLGAAHHSSIILLGLPFAAYLAAVDARLFVEPRRWAAPLAALVAPLVVLLYLPLRSAMNPSFDSPSVRTLGGFAAHVLALGFQGDFLYFLGRPTLGLRFGILADILRIEFGGVLAGLAMALGLWAGRRRPAWVLLWGGVVAVNAFAAVTYRAPQTIEYLIPSYVALAIALGLGLGTLLTGTATPLSPAKVADPAGERVPSPPVGERIGQADTSGHTSLCERDPSPPQGERGRVRGDSSPWRAVGRAGAGSLGSPTGRSRNISPEPSPFRRRGKAVALCALDPTRGDEAGLARYLRSAAILLAGLVAWLAVSNGLAAFPGFRTLHRDNSARQQAAALLEAAPQGALILANWHRATPLWYLQQVEGLRPDVTVTYVYPEGATPNGEVWARRIRDAAASRPVIVTNRYAEFAGLPYRLVPLGDAWRVEPGPAPADVAGLSGSPHELGDRLLFLGVRIAVLDASPGQAVSVDVAWRPTRPLDRDYSWFVHLVGPQGIAGQQDVTYQPSQASEGQAILDTYRFTLRPNAAPGEYRLIAGAYITFPDGTWQRLPVDGGSDAIELGTIRVHPRAEAPATAGPLDLAWADGSRLVGVDYDDSVAGQRRVYLHWYRPARSTNLDLTLMRGGQPVGHGQVIGSSEAGYQTVACSVPPGGALSLVASVQGQPLAALGPWNLPITWPAPLPGRPAGARYLDLGGEMVLTAVHWRPSVPIPGARLQAELQFLAAKPLTRDYSISLSIEGQGWHAQDDGTPALGAIPTLKWLPGWQLHDLRLLDIPATASGPARLRLAAYDAFTLETLAVGDDRLAQAGQGTQITLWEGTLP